jgi:hypothetical protein
MRIILKWPSGSNHWLGEHPLDAALQMWKQHGIDGILIPLLPWEPSATFALERYPESCREYGLECWFLISVFNNPRFLQRYPDERVIGRKKETIAYPGWFAPICPSSSRFLDEWIAWAEDLLKDKKADALVLDHLFVPVFWYGSGGNVAEEEWPPYCYCNRCLSRFEESVRKPLEDVTALDWIRWQQTRISAALEAIRACLDRCIATRKIGVQVPPLASPGSLQPRPQYAGLNLEALKEHTDFTSPVVYHGILGWSADQVLAYLVEWIARTPQPVVPSFQVTRTHWDRNHRDPAQTVRQLLYRITPLPVEAVTLFHAGDLLTPEKLTAVLP